MSRRIVASCGEEAKTFPMFARPALPEPMLMKKVWVFGDVSDLSITSLKTAKDGLWRSLSSPENSYSSIFMGAK